MIFNPKNLPYRKVDIRSSTRFYFYIAIPLVFIFVLRYYFDREAELNRWKVEEVKVVHATASSLSSYLYEALGDLLFIADHKNLFAGDASSNNQLAELFERISNIRRSYHDIRFVDLQGNEVVRIIHEGDTARKVVDKELQNKSNRPYFKSTIHLSPGDVYISRFDLNIEKGAIERPLHPVIRFALCVYDNNGIKKGVLVISYLGEKLLHQIFSLDSQLQSRLMLLNAEGYWLYSQQLADRWGFQLPNKRNIKEDYPEWEDIVADSSAQLLGDRGLLTHCRVGELDTSDKEWLTKYSPAAGIRLIFAEQPWHVVSVIDTELLYTESNAGLKYAVPGLLVLLIAMIPLSISWGRRRARAADAEARLQSRKVTQRLLKAQEEERRYIARELHDEFGQWVTAIQFDAQMISEVIGDNDSQILACTDGIKDSARQIHKTIRRMINTLRPAILELGLAEGLRELVSQWRSRNPDTECKLTLACDHVNLDSTNNITIYRVVQEALNNIAKHADANQVVIDLQEERSGSGDDSSVKLVLSIEDDGVGMDMTLSREEMGLPSMRERTISVGGVFRIQSKIGKGTRITASFPHTQA